MSLLGRLFDFQPGAIVKSQELDDEFNQIVNMLSGVSQNKSLFVRNNDAGFAAAKFDQLAANDIMQLASAGIVVAKFTQIGNLQITKTNPRLALVDGVKAFGIDIFNDALRFTNDRLGTTWLFNDQLTDVVTFLNIPLLPVANPTLANQAVKKQYVDDRITAFSAGFFYVLPPNAVESVESVPRFVVPTGTTIKITKLRILFGNGSHTAAATLTWTIKRRNSAGVLQADIGTISLSDTNGTINQLYENDIVDVTLTDGDQVYPLLTTRTGTITEQNVTVALIGIQNLT